MTATKLFAIVVIAILATIAPRSAKMRTAGAPTYNKVLTNIKIYAIMKKLLGKLVLTQAFLFNMQKLAF